MKFLTYKNRNELFVEDIAITEISNAVGTPFYCYSRKSLIENFHSFSDAFTGANIANYKICYAIKANYNTHLVRILAELGAGVDAVSAGEIFRAIRAGVNPQKIVFAGVGKTREEVSYALLQGVEEFSVESVPEMFLLNEVACGLRKKVKFSLRVNPNVDAKTHDKISTGRKGDKFGVDIDLAEEIYAQAAKLPGLKIHGISTHIGSQITSLEPFTAAFTKLRELCLRLRAQGYSISCLDFGGGIGILYKNENTLLIQDYADLIKELTCDLDVQITIAPGRALVGSAGVLVSKIIFLKEAAAKNFVVIDAAMNDLMRPGLYGAYHEVFPVVKKTGMKLVCDLVGPICETTDTLAKNRELIDPRADELLVLASAGAYGSSMSNEYNCRPLIPEVLVDGNSFKLIRRRPSFEEMLRLEF
ncbi:MAG: diaminopimelate decarboxylase [Alphaproteobacteria bacterium]|nr:diaminopimelate decarboxylase [Alphaproteobacteria bacterium]